MSINHFHKYELKQSLNFTLRIRSSFCIGFAIRRCSYSKYILSPNQNTILSVSDHRNNALNTSATITTPPNSDKDGVQLNIVNYRYDDLMDETDFSTFPTPDIPQHHQSASSSSGSTSMEALRSSRVFCCGDAMNVKSLLPRPGGAVQIVTDGTTTSSSQRRYESPDEVGEKAMSTIISPQDKSTAVARRQSSIKANGTSAHSASVSSKSVTTERSSSQSTSLSSNKSHAQNSQSSTHLLVADHKGHVKFLSDNHLDDLGTNSSVMMLSPSAGLEASASAGRMSSSSGADDDEEVEEEEENVSTAESMLSTSDRTQDDLIQFVFTSHGIRVISDKEYVV